MNLLQKKIATKRGYIKIYGLSLLGHYTFYIKITITKITIMLTIFEKCSITDSICQCSEYDSV